MNKNRLLRFTSLTLCTALTLIAINTLEQKLSDNGYLALHPSRVLAQTASERIARKVYAQASPAVVTVKTGNGSGSGFVVSPDGYIITNAHVIKPPPQSQQELDSYNPNNFPSVVTVQLSDGRQYSADVLGFAREGVDLAILKISAQNKLPTVTLASSPKITVGDLIFTLGSPLGPENKDTFTQGNITRINSSNGEIQHDAVIQRGNSGGPLLNTQAQVIGVNTSGVGNFNSGMNYAIPIFQVQSAIAQARQKKLSPVSTLVGQRKQVPVQTISLNGQVINGNLSQSDRVLEDGRLVNVYQFQGRANQQVAIEMNSQKMNAFLTLYQVIESPAGTEFKQIAENDDRGPGNFNALIATTLPEDGVYFIVATSSEKGESADYSLRATAN